MNSELQYCDHAGEYSWIENDARGIPLTKVCDKCQAVKLARYRRDVRTDREYWSDEPIDPDY